MKLEKVTVETLWGFCRKTDRPGFLFGDDMVRVYIPLAAVPDFMREGAENRIELQLNLEQWLCSIIRGRIGDAKDRGGIPELGKQVLVFKVPER